MSESEALPEAELPPEPDGAEPALSDADQAHHDTHQTEERTPMLDVHAPHETVHTWKDAFIHIGIICVGLLLAIGLESLVEHFHNQHLVAETRERLRQERVDNRKRFAQFENYIRWTTVEYENNMRVLTYLQQHPGTPQEKLPGILDWDHGDDRFTYSAWETARQSGLTELIPQDEVSADAKLYNDLHLAEDMAEQEFTAGHQAEAYIYQDANPSHLTPAEVADEIKMTRTLLMQHARYILASRLIGWRYPDFTSGPTDADSSQIRNTPDQQTQRLLAPATKLTLDRMKAAGWVGSPVSNVKK